MRGWIANLLFVVCAIAVEWISIRIIFFAAHDDGTGPPGLGMALILPFAIFVGTLVLYFASAAWVAIQVIWREK